MSMPTNSPVGDTTGQIVPEDKVQCAGLVTRVISWVLDAVLINLVAIMAGVGTALVLSIFPLPRICSQPWR